MWRFGAGMMVRSRYVRRLSSRKPVTHILQTFLLECPTSLGSVADDALTTIVMKYIEKELDDAEDEEVRVGSPKTPRPT